MICEQENVTVLFVMIDHFVNVFWLIMDYI